MNTRRIFYAILAMICIFSSCKKSLEEEVYGTIAELNSVSTINSATLGIYSAMQANLPTLESLFPMSEVGHRYSSYGSANEIFGNRDFYRYISNANNVEYNTTWSNLYRIINRSNEVIEAAESVIKDTVVANPLIAEAKFMRGWSYFVLVQFYGDVPLHIKATSSSSDPNLSYLPRTPVAAIYKQIVDDLKYASAIFPNGKTRLPLTWDAANLGRVTSGTALGMLGKVYLTMAGKPLNDPTGYANAISVLSTLVNQRGKYNTDLLPRGQYGRIFAQTNEMNREVLFAFRAFANSTNILQGSSLPSRLSPLFADVNAGTANISPGYGLRADINNLFESGDARLREGIGFIYADQRPASVNPTTGVRDSIIYNLSTKRYNKFTRNATTNAIIYGANVTANTGYGLGYTKWRSEVLWVGNNVRGYNNDWILFRFADVLLCYAEALNEAGQTNAAIPFLNEVRTRALASSIPLTTTQVNLRKIIREERTRELIGEFTTVFDMRRWGTVKDEMDNYMADQISTTFVSPLPVYNEKFNLYPIPYPQIAVNPKLTQNPGWQL